MSRTSADTAAAFLASYKHRSGRWGRDPRSVKNRRLRVIRAAAKRAQRNRPPQARWMFERNEQRRRWAAGEK